MCTTLRRFDPPASLDDVVGTGPEEHLRSDFEHMKTCLYVTDVVVLRLEGDTVNFWGLEITKTSKGFEVQNSTDHLESLLSLYGLENSKPTVNPGRRSTVMELASATLRLVKSAPTFAQASENLSSWHTLETRHVIRHPTTSTQVLNPTTESKRGVKQLIRYLKGTQHTCLRLEPHDVAVRFEMDSDSARHILHRRGPGRLEHIEIRCLAIQQWVRAKRLSVSRVDTKNNTADLFTKHLDGLRTQSFAKKLGLRILVGTDGTN